MAVEIRVPTLPESIADATMLEWHKSPGDAVRRDENLVDIETDKVVLEVVAPASGKLTAILKAEGEVVLPGDVLAHFEEGEAVAAPAAGAREVLEQPQAVEASGPASPSARKLAEENRIDVSAIAGSGRDGRVTKEDVLMAVADLASDSVALSAPPPDAPPAPAPVVPGERIERREIGRAHV